MDVIDKLRELIGSGYDGNVGDKVHEEVFEEILGRFKPEGYSVRIVDESFEDGGRWTNYETNIYRVDQGDSHAYFSVCREVPATEMQEGGDFTVEIYEVEPREVISITWEAI